MRIGVKLEGDLANEFRHLGDGVQGVVLEQLHAAAVRIESGMKLALRSDGKGGRVYRKYNPRRTHQASAPGQAPATDLGDLLKSISTEFDDAGATVIVNSPIAEYLEYGTRRMAARPFMLPAVEIGVTSLEEALHRELSRLD